MLDINRIYNMDCIEGMKLLDDNSIDLIVTSPPYDEIRDYKKGQWSLDLPEVGKQISRILKDGGMCVMVIQDQTKDGRKSGTSFRTIVNWIDNTELDLWECCIYQRSGVPGNWWSKRFRVDHEYIPVFIKGKRPQYFNKEHMMVECKNIGKKSSGNIRLTSGELLEKEFICSDKKCCGTIIDYESYRNQDNKNKIKKQHPATFPDKLASDFIQAFTIENMVVLDPFMGSGTVAVEAKKLNRNYIGFEIATTYSEIANHRLLDIV